MKFRNLLTRIFSILTITIFSSLTFATNTSAATTYEVKYDGVQFTPSVLTIEPGDIVRFVNASLTELDLASDPHPAHTDYPALNYGTVNISNGAALIVFPDSGDFAYHNHKQPEQKGTISVNTPATPTPEISPSSTPTPTSNITTSPTPTMTPTGINNEASPTPFTTNTNPTPTAITSTITPVVSPTLTLISPTPSSFTVLSLEVQIVDEGNKPLTGATVSMNYTSTNKTTDTSGKAIFTSVPIGNQLVTVTYGGETKTANFNITQTTSKITFNFVQSKSSTLPLIIIGAVLLLIIILAILTIVTYKRRRMPNKIVVGEETTVLEGNN